MAAKMVSLRLDPGLLDRIDERAAAEGVSRSAWMVAAFEAALAGPEPGAVAAAVHRGPIRVDTVPAAQQWALDRQARLNRAKDGAS
jgi:predicted transcriptional regulator